MRIRIAAWCAFRRKTGLRVPGIFFGGAVSAFLVRAVCGKCALELRSGTHFATTENRREHLSFFFGGEIVETFGAASRFFARKENKFGQLSDQYVWN